MAELQTARPRVACEHLLAIHRASARRYGIIRVMVPAAVLLRFQSEFYDNIRYELIVLIVDFGDKIRSLVGLD